ncbi:potassium transporter domain-containing protein [Ditylenchus destructor]|nr:potassium transporter domain-containing protein [Ditylenchus destructor]
MRVVYTSAHAMGQVYLPAINWTLLVAVLLAVLGFESSRRWPRLRHRGDHHHADHHRADLLRRAPRLEVPRTPGLGRHRRLHRGKELLAAQVAGDDLPLVHALMHNLKHNKVLHERNVVLTVRFEEVPYMPEDQQLSVEPLPGGFWRVLIRYGFKDEPNIPAALGRCARHDLQFDPFLASYFLSREVVVPAAKKSAAGLAPWRSKLFATMARNGSSAADYFRLPDNARKPHQQRRDQRRRAHHVAHDREVVDVAVRPDVDQVSRHERGQTARELLQRRVDRVEGAALLGHGTPASVACARDHAREDAHEHHHVHQHQQPQRRAAQTRVVQHVATGHRAARVEHPHRAYRSTMRPISGENTSVQIPVTRYTPAARSAGCRRCARRRRWRRASA